MYLAASRCNAGADSSVSDAYDRPRGPGEDQQGGEALCSALPMASRPTCIAVDAHSDQMECCKLQQIRMIRRVCQQVTAQELIVLQAEKPPGPALNGTASG